MPLTDTQIKQAKPSDKAYRLYDMDGLYLVINPNSSKTWRYKFRLDKKEYTYTIGKYPEISLRMARDELRTARNFVQQGINPTHERSRRVAQNVAAQSATFKQIAEEWINSKTDCSNSYIDGLKRDFKNYVYPVIGMMPIDSITPAQIKICLDKCAKKKIIVTGINIRNRMSSVFRYAIRTMRTEKNPAEAFESYLKRPEITHAEALSIESLKYFKARYAQYNGTLIVRSIIKFIFYTGVRTVEARKAEWQEIDFERKLWHIPANKMKKSRPHVIPLSNQVLELLQDLHKATGGGRLLFPNMKRPDDLISTTTVNRALEYMGVKMTGHDFRATLATHLSDLGFEYEHIKAQLSHAKDNQTDAAYFHAKFLKQRSIMLQAWADFIDSL